jgi:cell division protein WhiA
VYTYITRPWPIVAAGWGMSLSEDVRTELAAIAPSRECDRLAELSALFHCAGRWHMRGGEVSLHLDLASSAVARRAFSLLRTFDVESQLRTYRRRAFERGTRYQLHVAGTERALQVLHEAGVVDTRVAPLERPPKRVIGRSCCRAAYLRGALLASGSVSAPPSSHLEVRSATVAGAEAVALAAAGEDTELRVSERSDHAVAYAKGIDRIAGVLAAAGASDAALVLQERAVVGATKSHANRLANADHANLVRAGRAAHKQLEAARRLEREGQFEGLSRPVREVAELRLRHPSLSLREVGLKCRPPASKAAVHRRFQKLIQLMNS